MIGTITQNVNAKSVLVWELQVYFGLKQLCGRFWLFFLPQTPFLTFNSAEILFGTLGLLVHHSCQISWLYYIVKLVRYQKNKLKMVFLKNNLTFSHTNNMARKPSFTKTIGLFFRCVITCLYEGLSVCPFIRISVFWSIRRSTSHRLRSSHYGSNLSKIDSFGTMVRICLNLTHVALWFESF